VQRCGGSGDINGIGSPRRPLVRSALHFLMQIAVTLTTLLYQIIPASTAFFEPFNTQPASSRYADILFARLFSYSGISMSVRTSVSIRCNSLIPSQCSHLILSNLWMNTNDFLNLTNNTAKATPSMHKAIYSILPVGHGAHCYDSTGPLKTNQRAVHSPGGNKR
jgi:hypothetical protein